MFILQLVGLLSASATDNLVAVNVPVEYSCAVACGFDCSGYYRSSPTLCMLCITCVHTDNSRIIVKSEFPVAYTYLKEAVVCPSVLYPWNMGYNGYTFYVSTSCHHIRPGKVVYPKNTKMFISMDTSIIGGEIEGDCPIFNIKTTHSTLTVAGLTITCTQPSDHAIIITDSNSANIILTDVVVVNAHTLLKITDSTKIHVAINNSHADILLDAQGTGLNMNIECVYQQRIIVYDMYLPSMFILSTQCILQSLKSTANTQLTQIFPVWHDPPSISIDTFPIIFTILVCIIASFIYCINDKVVG